MNDGSFSAVPGAPSKPLIRGSDEQSISIEWSAPQDDGNSPITEYIVEVCAEGERTWKKCGQSINCEFVAKGLSDENRYQFRVSAVNAVGTGKASQPSDLARLREFSTVSYSI